MTKERRGLDDAEPEALVVQDLKFHFILELRWIFHGNKRLLDFGSDMPWTEVLAILVWYVPPKLTL